MSNKKTETIALLLSALLMISAVFVTLTTEVKAQLQPNMGMPLPPNVTVNYTRTTFAFLSVSPNPIGIGQEALVNIWTTPGLDRFKGHRDYKVTITKPDGSQIVRLKDSYWADGTSWFTLVPDQVGEWQLKFEFPGNYFPAGTYSDPRATGGVDTRAWNEYYLPSSTPVTKLIVQADPVHPWPLSTLPNDYWTRPIQVEHREWWTIAGSFPWRGPAESSEWNEHYPNTNPYWGARQQFTPWTLGPESPHIVWKEMHDLTGGLIGGDLESFYRDASATNPTILYNGLGFRSLTRVVAGEPMTVWECFDIRTGELVWQRRNVTALPTVIDYDVGVLAVPGVLPKPARPDFVHLGGGRLIKYNPITGAMDLNVSISPMTGTGGTYYRNAYVLGVQDLGAAAGAARYRLINWTTLGSTTNFTERVVSNVTFAWASLGTDQDFNVGIAAWTTGGGRDDTRIRAACLVTGRELWDVNTTKSLYMTGCTIADNGKVAVLFRDGYYQAWDLRTGTVAWTGEKFTYPWGESAWASYSVSSAYGMIYQQTNDGVYAFDWKTGKMAWKYEDISPYQFEYPFTGANGSTVIPMYNFGAGLRIADGKIYATNAQHSPEMPFRRGFGVHAINALTGERIWRISIRQSGFGTASVGQVHDGYFSVAASDGYFYMFGKGRSKTTVSAPMTGVQVGQSFTITGTVVDMSPAQPGTPAISDKDMGAWMEYLHKQMPKPTDAKGVPVKLAAIDPNNNWIDIGEATSDLNGVFGYSWAPEVPGLYQVIATFAGSESYGSSSASTYFTAVEAPPAPAEPEPEPPSMTDTYVLYSAVAIIATIVVVGVVIVLLTRKRVKQ